MKLRIHIATIFCLSISTLVPLAAAEAGIVIDCAGPTLPSQHVVAAAMNQHNFGQAYATRARLMAEARRACQREHVTNVRLVREAPPHPQHRLAGPAGEP